MVSVVTMVTVFTMVTVVTVVTVGYSGYSWLQWLQLVTVGYSAATHLVTAINSGCDCCWFHSVQLLRNLSQFLSVPGSNAAAVGNSCSRERDESRGRPQVGG
jgi:hypothetical protein